jgi:hypothetical protein
MGPAVFAVGRELPYSVASKELAVEMVGTVGQIRQMVPRESDAEVTAS